MKWTRFRSAGRLFGTIAVALLMTLVDPTELEKD